ncbi:MAG TPA: hypothetical protein VFE24_07095 [Pirellulales bacterium]|nr:hypothetical protein [Pirellulales bacterium]
MLSVVFAVAHFTAPWNGPAHAAAPESQTAAKPLLRDFIGINGHTIQFKPELYAKVCRLVRDYHSFEWDMGRDTDFTPRFPEARNRVNWDSVYGSWQKAGFDTDVCVMFNNTPPDAWKSLEKDPRAYGQAFARAFGPSSAGKLVSAVEVGNEPGKYSDEKYHTLLESMAGGLRAGDPRLKIVTCNLTTKQSGNYEKSVVCLKGLDKLYDVLNIHTYALAAGWPTWRRTFPEDPHVDFLKSVQDLIAWRKEHVPGKEIWITEFGWDASTKPNRTDGDFAKWAGNVSDEKQAQYLVRAFLVFSALDVNRAYLYFFNDANEPSFHAASGITRDFQPKASFYALAHLYRTLGDYRFRRVIAHQAGEAYVYEFQHGAHPEQTIVVAWSPTGSKRTAEFSLPLAGAKLIRAERMPLTDRAAEGETITVQDGTARLPLTESPIYLWLAK